MRISDKVSFSGDPDSKESACNAGDPGPIPGLGRSPGEGNGFSLQYSGLENSMDCKVHELHELDTKSDFHTSYTKYHLCTVHHVKCEAG